MKNSNEEQSMSRSKDREIRDSDSRRHRPRFDREPSPKRSRRDGKLTEERERNKRSDDKDERYSRHLQERDALPHEYPSKPGTKVVTNSVSKESDKKTSGYDDGAKTSLVPNEVPRSRSSFKHDERGRSFGRKEPAERRGRDSKDQSDHRETNRTAYDTKQRDEKSRTKENGNKNGRRDEVDEVKADQLPPPPPLPRKRPAFTEKKITVNPEIAEVAAREPIKPRSQDLVSGSERREERGRDTHQLNKPEKHYAGDRALNRREWKDGFAARDRYRNSGGPGNDRGSDRFRGGQANRMSDTGAKKWKHDLFEKTNWGPDPKNEEEDHIAKVEALLSS